MNQQFVPDEALQAIRAEKLRRQTGGKIPAPRTLDREDWPPNYDQVYAWRSQQLARLELDPDLAADAIAYYAKPEHAVDFINHWCDTLDPRNMGRGRSVRMPLVLFRRQEELVHFFLACMMGDANGLVEKSRDMGATWVAIAFSVWLWLFFGGVSVGWGSNNLEQVDVRGDPDTIFEKMRQLIWMLPDFLRPKVVDGQHLKLGRCQNPDNGAVVRGQGGVNIGRGGRSRLYFVDEAAHLEHAESVAASLSENTRCRIDISSVSGLGTMFHRARESGVEWSVGQEVRRDRTNVFILDWKDHPEKTLEWYNERRAYWVSQGTPQVVAREIDRDYSASVHNVIIPYEWLQSCVDAHKKLGFDDSGGTVAGLDIADGGMDVNALVKRRGSVLYHVEEWGERDVNATARRAIAACRGDTPLEIQYDASPVGSGVKGEVNRLRSENRLPKNMVFVPWLAGARVLNPAGRIYKNDKNSPSNRNFYANLKAQAWWEFRMRVHRTHQALTEEDVEFDPGEFVSLDSRRIGGLLPKLMKELCQPTSSQDGRMRLIVNKAPEGTKSPNLADAAIMAFWPWKGPGRGSTKFYLPELLEG